jgi:hypothetical protein
MPREALFSGNIQCSAPGLISGALFATVAFGSGCSDRALRDVQWSAPCVTQPARVTIALSVLVSRLL